MENKKCKSHVKMDNANHQWRKKSVSHVLGTRGDQKNSALEAMRVEEE